MLHARPSARGARRLRSLCPYSSKHPIPPLMFTTEGHAKPFCAYSPDHSYSDTSKLRECSGISWRCQDPHRAKVVCIVQEIPGAIRRQILLLSCFHQLVHIPVQLGRVEMVHYLTLHSTPAGLGERATAACRQITLSPPRAWRTSPGSTPSASADDFKETKGCGNRTLWHALSEWWVICCFLCIGANKHLAGSMPVRCQARGGAPPPEQARLRPGE